MSTRIERAWGAFQVGQTAVKRKDSADKEGSGKQEHHKQEKRDEPEQKADREQIQKAVEDLRAAGDFTATGMKVEAFETEEGLRVRLAQPNGTTVKVMSAEEFLKLRDASVNRGKILDQKV